MSKAPPKTITVLGNTYVDIITGFEGVATGKASYLTGCDQTCLRPKKLNKDGDGPAEGHWFDDTQLVARNGAPAVALDTSPLVGAGRREGGPNRDTPKRR